MAYKDRSGLAQGERAEKLKGRDFLNMMIIKGRIAGLWKRTLEKKQVTIEVSPLTSLNASEKSALEKASKQYGKFLGLSPKLHISQV